ncbi:Crp/Fnr family transcriptional regulator [Mucilaginibacter sp. JRF]|nr:Crp/Fnr family transcriptional regulator [Mucilaginibacter sp. JRF]
MYESLFNYIADYSRSSITKDEEDLIKNAFRPKILRKNQYFLQDGDVSKYTGFITKGAMRQYYLNKKGDEVIVNLFIENYWATDRESFFNLKPSAYNIDACEDTELLIITRADLAELMKKIPALVEMIRVMDDRHAIAAQKRLASTINNKAEDRYEELLRSNPQFIQRFPQHQIASYLGITKETLSRLKKARK